MKKIHFCSQVSLGIVSFGIALITGCAPDIPKECGENVKRVVGIDFSGPSAIPGTGDNNFAGYAVTITIEKEDATKPAKVCYAVRDEDPWIKGPWAVDDVLDAFFMDLLSDQNTRTREGQFVLEVRDGEICGWGALAGAAKVKGCSGESEAEVYLQPLGSSGPDSPIHKIHVQ